MAYHISGSTIIGGTEDLNEILGNMRLTDITASGDMIYAGPINNLVAMTPVANGVLTTSLTTPSWIAPGTDNDVLTMVLGTPVWATSAPAPTSQYGYFYGLTAGVGQDPAPTDYPATIGVGTAVPFPQNGPATTGFTAITTDSFQLPNIATYKVSWKVHTTEPGQLQLTLDGTVLPQSTSVNANPTSGGHPIIGNVIFTTTGVNSVIQVINPVGNSTALTITPADENLTHANAQSLSIKQL